MATNPRKTPNDAALSAVEEALRLDFGAGEDSERERPPPRRPPEPRAPEPPRQPAMDAPRRPEGMQRRAEAPRMPAPPRRAEGPSQPPPPRRPESAADIGPPPPLAQPAPQPQPQMPPPARPRAAEQRGRGRFAANDDRRAPVSAGTYPRRPSRLIYPVAMGLSVLWAVIAVGVALSIGGDVPRRISLGSPGSSISPSSSSCRSASSGRSPP